MSEITRRDACSAWPLAIAAAGVIDRARRRRPPRCVAAGGGAAGGSYVPKALSAHEFATLERLTDLIIPAERQARRESGRGRGLDRHCC